MVLNLRLIMPNAIFVFTRDFCTHAKKLYYHINKKLNDILNQYSSFQATIFVSRFEIFIFYI
jgi:hypothetical protein